MEIRKRNDNQELNKAEIKLRDIGSGMLRVSGRAEKTGRGVKQFRDRAFIKRMSQKSELKTREVLAAGRTKLERETIAGLTKKQRKAWKKLSAREQAKLLQKVEKKVNRKMLRMYPDEKQKVAKKKDTSSYYTRSGPEEKIKKKAIQRRQKSAVRARASQTPRIKNAVVGNGMALNPSLAPGARRERKIPAAQGKQLAEIKRRRERRKLAKGETRTYEIAPKIKNAVARKGLVFNPSPAPRARRERNMPAAQGKQLAEIKRRREQRKLAESEHKKRFEKRIKRIRKDQRKAYKRETHLTMARELDQMQQKEDAKKEIQKQMSIAQIQEQQLKRTFSVMALPISSRIKAALGRIVVKIAAMAASLVASVVSLLLPFLVLLASLIFILNIVFSIVAFISDDSSAGLPDAAYVQKSVVTWATYIAENDEKHGYNDGLFSRWGQKGDYGNCTFVVTAFDKTGLELKRAGATKVSKMYDAFTENGFLDVTDKVTLSNGKGLEAGDVLIKTVKSAGDCRVEIIDKNGRMIGAVCDERGKQKGGQKGDQTGKEICIEKYKNLGWTYVLRYYGDTALYGGIGEELAKYACSFAGKLPYVYGGTSLVTGCDCSGFVQAVYAHFGYTLPRTAGSIYQYSRKLSKDVSTWQPGDIIYYSSTGTVQTGGGKSEHIGIYIGDGKVVQCGSGGVSIKDNYNYNGHFYGAGRILPDYDGSAVLTGNNNAQKIWNYLRKVMGCSRAAAAGIIGNMYGECTTFDPAAIQSNGVGHGIVQWSYDRWSGSNGLAAYAKKHGRSWSDLALQLSFFKFEIDNHIVGGVDSCIPGGWEKYKKMAQVSGSGGSVHLWFNAFEYNGGTFSYDWLMNEGDKKWGFKSHRLAFALSCYKDVKNYP